MQRCNTTRHTEALVQSLLHYHHPYYHLSVPMGHTAGLQPFLKLALVYSHLLGLLYTLPSQLQLYFTTIRSFIPLYLSFAPVISRKITNQTRLQCLYFWCVKNSSCNFLIAAGPAGTAGAVDQAAASKTGKYVAPGLREGAASRRGETMPRSQRGMYSQEELQEFQASEIRFIGACAI